MKKSVKILLMVSLFVLWHGHSFGYYLADPHAGTLLHSDESEIYYHSLTSEYWYISGGNFWGGVVGTTVMLEPGDLPTDLIQINIYYYFSESFTITLNNFANDPTYFPPSSSTPATLVLEEIQTRALGNSDFAVDLNYVPYMDSLVGNHRTLWNVQPPPIDPTEDAYADSESLQQYWVTVKVSDAVPIPGAVWLLGTGLIGLIGTRKFFRR